jgi:hypothetical protein
MPFRRAIIGLFAILLLTTVVSLGHTYSTSASPRPVADDTSRPPSPVEAKATLIFSAPEIAAGFQQLYNLRFPEAREQFTLWQANHPEDPLGDVSIAASYLFEEFYSQGVLSSAYFLDNKRLLGGIEGKPDESRAAGFRIANERARMIALRRLEGNPHDTDALYALTLATGMEADYSGIIEKRHLQSLHLIKQADAYANQLLMAEPDAKDAWLALGAADYIIGSLPPHKRFFLRFGGIHGNKEVGLSELRQTAEKGVYLRPYAKMLLAFASLREGQDDTARALFSELSAEFPNNSLIAVELAKLNKISHEQQIFLKSSTALLSPPSIPRSSDSSREPSPPFFVTLGASTARLYLKLFPTSEVRLQTLGRIQQRTLPLG